MKMNREQEKNMTQAELEALVEKYFDCETTEEEEVELKRALSKCRFYSPIIEEALVAMGFYAIGRKLEAEKSSGKTVSFVLRVVSVAAMLALIITFSVNFMNDEQYKAEGFCVAYVNGLKVDDSDEVLALMKNNLNDVNLATEMESNSMESQLSEIRSIMSIDEIK